MWMKHTSDQEQQSAFIQFQKYKTHTIELGWEREEESWRAGEREKSANYCNAHMNRRSENTFQIIIGSISKRHTANITHYHRHHHLVFSSIIISSIIKLPCCCSVKCRKSNAQSSSSIAHDHPQHTHTPRSLNGHAYARAYACACRWNLCVSSVSHLARLFLSFFPSISSLYCCRWNGFVLVVFSPTHCASEK